jgi:hypothetical protein
MIYIGDSFGSTQIVVKESLSLETGFVCNVPSMLNFLSFYTKQFL